MSDLLPSEEGLTSPEPAETIPARGAPHQRSLFAWALLMSAVCLAGQFLVLGLMDAQPSLAFVLGLTQGLFVTIAPAWIIRRHGQLVFDQSGPLQFGRELGYAATALAGLLFSMCLINLVMLGPLGADETDRRVEQFQQLQHFGSAAGWVAFALAACVWAPIFEEIAFRRFLFRAFEDRMGLWPAMLVSSAIFAALHAYGWYRTVLIFGIGMLLCYVYSRRRTLATPMLLHAGLNGLMTAVLLAQSLLMAKAPLLGITGEPAADGLQIVSIKEGLPAEQAGLRVGDLLLNLDETRIRNIADVQRVLITHKIGDVVSAKIQREGSELSFPVHLTHPPQDAPPEEYHPATP